MEANKTNSVKEALFTSVCTKDHLRSHDFLKSHTGFMEHCDRS